MWLSQLLVKVYQLIQHASISHKTENFIFRQNEMAIYTRVHLIPIGTTSFMWCPIVVWWLWPIGIRRCLFWFIKWWWPIRFMRWWRPIRICLIFHLSCSILWVILVLNPSAEPRYWNHRCIPTTSPRLMEAGLRLGETNQTHCFPWGQS